MLDEFNMREHHSSAAVSLELELVERISFVHVVLEQLHVCVPLVPDDLAAREAADGDDHLLVRGSRSRIRESVAMAAAGSAIYLKLGI